MGFGGAGGGLASMPMLPSVVPTATWKIGPMMTMADSVSGLRRRIGWVPARLSDSELEQPHGHFVAYWRAYAQCDICGWLGHEDVVVCIEEIELDGFGRVGEFGRKV
jgi:hypothetical protein